MRISPLYLIPVLGLVACSATPTGAEASKEHLALDEVDAAFREHIDGSALPVRIESAAVMRDQLAQKKEGIESLERAYGAFTDSRTDSVAARAFQRQGQLFLNLACEMATVDIGVESDDERVQQAARTLLERQAEPLVDRSRKLFQKATDLVGETSEPSTLLQAVTTPSDVSVVCLTTEQFWAAASRPTGIVEVTESECMEAVASGGEPKACRDIYLAACDVDNGEACYGAGMLAYRGGELDLAATSFDKACKLTQKCAAAVAVAAPSKRAQYTQKCAAGDAIGCLKAATAIEQRDAQSSLKQCTATTGLQPGDARRRCAKGEASACWVRAAELLANNPVMIPTDQAGLLGGLGTRGTGGTKETREQKRARLTQSCEEGENQWACLDLADMDKEDGVDPTPHYREACKNGPLGCHQLAEYLVVRGPAGASEAMQLYGKNCDDGYSPSCLSAAQLYSSGSADAPVASNPGCAAAFAWRSCQPDRWWNCNDINAVFGHE